MPRSDTFPQQVGVVGVGAMGDPISRRLAAAEHTVRIFDLDAARLRSLAADGLRQPATLPEIAECDLVILMLPDSDAVEAVVLQDGLLDLLPPETILIDMGSSDPRRTVALGAGIREKGVEFADAPVSGGVARASLGELTTMVGASETVFMRIEPVLRSLASNIFHVGKLGSGHAAKALNNLLSATGLLIAGEAVEAGSRFGIDPATLLELVNVSTGMNHATKNKIEQYVLSGTFDSGFRAALMLKDLRIARGLCEEMALGTTLAGSVVDAWASATTQLGPEADQTEVVRVTAQRTNADTAALS